jgi:hypothetical protein
LRLQARSNVDSVPVQISGMRNRIADLDANTEADTAIGRLVAIIHRHLLLHLHGTAYCTVDAIERDQQ